MESTFVIEEFCFRFDNYESFLLWVRLSDIKPTQKIKILLENIIYSSVLQVMQAFEE